MKAVLDVLSRGDSCPLFLGALLLLFVGSRVCDESRQRWGAGLGVLAFFAYGCCALATSCPTSAEALLDVIVRGLVAGGMTMGLAWVAQPLVGFLYRHAVLLPGERWRAGVEAASRRRAERARLREQEEARRRREEEHARSAPERERAQREAEAAARERAEAQRRRQEARAACEVLYATHAPEVRPRLPRKALQDYLERHCGDDRAPEYVEERARQLREVIEWHARKADPSPAASAFPDVLDAYRREVERVEAADLDMEWKETLLAKLKDQLGERLLRRLEEP